jgi:BASS family bile acid:Na+ symporter
MLCAIGLGSTLADLTYLFRRPALLLRSLLAMYVAMPLAALALVRSLPLPSGCWSRRPPSGPSSQG